MAWLFGQQTEDDELSGGDLHLSILALEYAAAAPAYVLDERLGTRPSAAGEDVAGERTNDATGMTDDLVVNSDDARTTRSPTSDTPDVRGMFCRAGVSHDREACETAAGRATGGPALRVGSPPGRGDMRRLHRDPIRTALPVRDRALGALRAGHDDGHPSPPRP
ncbi:hypothetical protein PSA01_44460 [Pseudonocardia saturnea]|uniref:Uncharacterized protein n=1 Tax=Pseudonocardia saturnea TaxID=33909 RepID=A0ABQ0S3E9_9PSEU|nr:hypothetical protein PSA01_44460 [Pseudonocardia saturnea]